MLFNMLWQKKASGLDKKYWSYYAQIIIIGVYLRYILRNWGLKYMPAVKMGFLVNSTPFIAALFSYLFFNELLTRKQWIGLALGFLGYIPILLTSSSAEYQLGEMFFVSWPELAIFAAVIAQCYYMTITRRLIRDHNHSASLTNGIRMFGGGFLALLTAFAFEPMAITHGIEFSFWLAVLIVVSNIICHNFFLHLLKYYSITFLSFTDFLSPIFTGMYSWYFLKEVISWHYFVGAAVIIVGLYLFYQDELGVSHAKAKSVATA
jgi:drug/metabolite transporter (DMT)-like permease